MTWNVQTINNSHNTSGPPAVADPAVSLFNGQQHIAYRDAAGAIWDSWYNPSDNSWNLQKINLGGKTNGPAANAGPFLCWYLEQLHYIYVTNLGEIYDSWYNGQGNTWSLQKINAGGVTQGQLANIVGNVDIVSLWTYIVGPLVAATEEMHCTYLGADFSIYDAFFNGHSWILGKINNSGNTAGPLAVAGPVVCVFNQQQHFAYQDSAGNLWDSWYDGSGNWNLQKINNGGNTNGPPIHSGAGSRYSVWVNSSGSQQHFTYLGSDSALYDAYWDNNGNVWDLQKINVGGRTTGPNAASAPTGCAFNNQQHIGYRDAAGNIWDAWNDGSGNWDLQKINNGGRTSGDSGVGNVRIWVTGGQQHFTYRDGAGTITDAFWDTPAPSDLTVTPSSISFHHHVDLSGPEDGNIAGDIFITISPDGSWNFSGNLNNSNRLPNSVQLIIFIGYDNPKIGFLWNNQSSIGANIPFVNNNWSWNNTGNYAEIKNNWNLFQVGNWCAYNATANLDINAVYQGVYSGLTDIKNIEQVFGSIVNPNPGSHSGG